MKKIGFIFPLILSVSAASFASNEPNIKFAGKINTLIPIYQGIRATNNPEILANGGKRITLQHVILSQAAQQYLADHIDNPFTDEQSTPRKIELGMNNVPVLDQGLHGTCVTFAITGILDSALAKGDYISQLCNLELGNYLELQDKEYPSGWDGSYGQIVLDQIKQYGVINKTFQKERGCSGVYDYPTWDEKNNGAAMTIRDFTKHSEKIESTVTWKTILPPADALSDRGNADQLVKKAKQALMNKHRLVLGFLLDVQKGGIGTFASHKAQKDTWVVTPEIANHAKRNKLEAGHELIIIGFDDNATVTDTQGRKHKGLFTLRNSWGEDAGDSGNFYMSYDYLQKLGVELQEILPLKA